MTSNLRELELGNLWVAEEPHKLFGVPVGARSTIVRLADGGLWVHSPVALTSQLREAVDALGPVRCIVAPTKLHTAYPASWATAYPEAKVFVSPQWTKTLPAPPQVLGAEPEAMWNGVLKQALLRGSALSDEVVFFHPRSKTLIVCDLIFNLPPTLSAGQKVLAKVLGLPFEPAPSRTFRLTAGDKAALRASLERTLTWEFERIVLSHGQVVEQGGRQVLRDAFGWLWQNG